MTALHEGYTQRAGSLPAGFEERTPVYNAVRFLGTSGFFEKWVEFTDQPPAEAATWVETEMQRRLENSR
ncbi:hypothetical protein [Natronorubrum halalkaliphilum]|uniref:hypothetical protein n=1 Tax=Natronorubrum halalkaliphilum TaxID=2691917 RepID=UPI001F1C2E78|nr:hypothetical protein [Natronorubrum halalkaliphilum]